MKRGYVASWPIPLKKSVLEARRPNCSANRLFSDRFWPRHWDQLS